MKSLCLRLLALVGMTTSGLSLDGCATAPRPAPTVLATPAQGESFLVFQQHDTECRQYAATQTGSQSPDQAAEQNEVQHIGVDTAVGAGAGALIGAAAGHAGHGAAIGAAAGLVVGAIKGAHSAESTAAVDQHNYDISYSQCMAGNGEHVETPAPLVAVYRGLLVPHVVYVTPVTYAVPVVTP